MVLSDPARREKYDRTGSTEPESENAFESEAMGLVGGLLQNAVMPPPNAPALDLDRYDIAAVMRQSLRDLIAQADRDIATVKKQIERAGKARARWVKKNKAKNAAPGDPILDMLGQMERERREVLEKAEYQRRVLLREQTPVPDVLACDDRSLILCLSDMSRLSGSSQAPCPHWNMTFQREGF